MLPFPCQATTNPGLDRSLQCPASVPCGEVLWYSSAAGVLSRPEQRVPGREMGSRKLQARDPEIRHPISLSTDLKGKSAGQRSKTCKEPEVPAASSPSASGCAAGERARRDGSKQDCSGLQPLLQKIKPVKEVEANAPGGGVTGQVGKAFKCTLLWSSVGDGLVTVPKAQGERHLEQAGCKSRGPWPEQPFLTLSHRKRQVKPLNSHIERFGATKQRLERSRVLVLEGRGDFAHSDPIFFRLSQSSCHHKPGLGSRGDGFHRKGRGALSPTPRRCQEAWGWRTQSEGLFLVAPDKLKTSLPAVHSVEASSLLRGGRLCCRRSWGGGSWASRGWRGGEPQEWKGALPKEIGRQGVGAKCSQVTGEKNRQVRE